MRISAQFVISLGLPYEMLCHRKTERPNRSSSLVKKQASGNKVFFLRAAVLLFKVSNVVVATTILMFEGNIVAILSWGQNMLTIRVNQYK